MTDTEFPYEVLDEEKPIKKILKITKNSEIEDTEDNDHQEEEEEEEEEEKDEFKPMFHYDVLNKFYYEYPLVGTVYDNSSYVYNYAKTNKYTKVGVDVIEKPVYYVADKFSQTFEPQLKKVDAVAMDQIERVESVVKTGVEKVKILPNKIKTFPDTVLTTSEGIADTYLPQITNGSDTSLKKKDRKNQSYKTRTIRLASRIIEGLLLFTLRLIQFVFLVAISIINELFQKTLSFFRNKILKLKIVQSGKRLLNKLFEYLLSFKIINKIYVFALNILVATYNKVLSWLELVSSQESIKKLRRKYENEDEEPEDEQEEQEEEEEEEVEEEQKQAKKKKEQRSKN